MVKMSAGTLPQFKLRWLISILGVIFTLFIVWVQVSSMAGSGITNRQGDISFDSGATYYDAGVHLSLISEMTHRFPPTNFALNGLPLKNYHYLYDAALALIVKLTNLSPFDLYYRIGPVFISLALCAALYLTIWRLTRNHWAASVGIFFSIMATSLGSLAQYSGGSLPGHAIYTSNNLFMTDQIYDMMVNPQGVLSLVIYLCLFLCLSYFQETKRGIYLIAFAFLLGISFGVKAYGGVVFATGAVFAGFHFILTKNFRPAIAITVGLGLMGLWYFTMTDNSKVGLTFAPLWFLDRMMSDYEHLYQADFPVLIKMYLFVGNWWHPLFLYIKALLIYLVGSLGLRIFGLIPVFWTIKNIRGLTKISPANVFFVFVAFGGFVIPLFFNQSSKPFDIVQFIPYFTLATGIGFTIFLFRLISKLPPPARVAIVFLTIISFLFLDRQELSKRLTPVSADSRIVLSANLLAATNYLKSNTPGDSIILLAPTDRNLGYLWFTSVSGRRTVLSGEFFSKQIGANYLPTEEQVKNAFAGLPSSLNFGYVFLQADEKKYYEKIKTNYNLQTIFDNDAAAVYKRI